MNRVNDLKERHGISKLNCNKWDNICLDVKLAVQRKLLEKVSTEKVIEQLYISMCEWNHSEPNLKISLEKQLEFIKRILLQIESMNRKYARKHKSGK